MPNAKTKLIIIAGPQSSGKTTVFKRLQQKYPHWSFFPEINPYFFNKQHLGAAFADKKLTLMVTDKEIESAKRLIGHKQTLVLETSIFHLVYVKFYAGEKEANQYFQTYLRLYDKFDPLIIFIDTKPEISWQRRKEKYLKRLANIPDPRIKNEMFSTYQQRLYDLYPLWLKYYYLIPFKKIMIRNSFKTYERFINEVLTNLQSLLPTYPKPKRFGTGS